MNSEVYNIIPHNCKLFVWRAPMVQLILNEPSLLSSSCLHFKEMLILMTTDKKMKKNSFGFTKKAYHLECNFTWQNWLTVHQLYQ